MRINLTKIAIPVLFIALVATSFLGGYAIRHYDLTPFLTNFFIGIKAYITGSNDYDHTVDNVIKFDSIFLKLKGEIGIVPVSREGSGGGLTTFGDAIVVLTHEGKVYAETSSDNISEIQIKPPDNGFNDYVRAAESEKYKNYNHYFIFFRYNDIMYFDSSIGHGFAISYTEFDKEK
jgi:hypothetical protein